MTPQLYKIAQIMLKFITEIQQHDHTITTAITCPVHNIAI